MLIAALALLALLFGFCAGRLSAQNLDDVYLTDRDVRLIREYWPVYQKAGDRVGVPAALLAAVHFRESELYLGYFSKRTQSVTKNIGGPFMLDFGPEDDPAEFCRRIRAHEAKMAKLYGFPRGTRVSANFLFAATLAAHELKSKARYGLVTDEGIADAVWGYNGRAAWHRGPDGKRTHKASSYVWNDPKRGHVLNKRYTTANGTVNIFPDTRPGVMVIFREIQKRGLSCQRH